MRLVLDTNILARVAGSPSGPAGELFELIAAAHSLVASPELLSELARVLAYDRVRRMHRLTDQEISAFVESIESGSVVVPLPAPVPRVVPHDPDDDVVVATAFAGGADVLCTRNRHLYHQDVVAYCRQHAVEIMDDVDLLARLRQLDESQRG